MAKQVIMIIWLFKCGYHWERFCIKGITEVQDNCQICSLTLGLGIQLDPLLIMYQLMS